jgi:mRNA interferase MazF
MKQGEVWRVRLPSTPGHTQAGERPAIIVQDDSFIRSLPTVLIVPFTSTAAALRFAGTLLVQPDSQNGLTLPSVALVFQLSAVDKRNCVQHLGLLDPQTFDQVLALHGSTDRALRCNSVPPDRNLN